MAKQGICVDCKQGRALVARGLCSRCYKHDRERAALSPPPAEALPAPMAAAAGPLTRMVMELLQLVEGSQALAADANNAGEIALGKIKPLREGYIRERDRNAKLAEGVAKLDAGAESGE